MTPIIAVDLEVPVTIWATAAGIRQSSSYVYAIRIFIVLNSAREMSQVHVLDPILGLS